MDTDTMEILFTQWNAHHSLFCLDFYNHLLDWSEVPISFMAVLL